MDGEIPLRRIEIAGKLLPSDQFPPARGILEDSSEGKGTQLHWREGVLIFMFYPQVGKLRTIILLGW